jgi:hypothetical protein
MEPRFKLTADGNVHIDHNDTSYTETLENALLDITAAGLSVAEPDLASVSGAVAVVGFEVSDVKKEFILENGWHYPMTAAQIPDYLQYVSCIVHVSEITQARCVRRGEGEAVPA